MPLRDDLLELLDIDDAARSAEYEQRQGLSLEVRVIRGHAIATLRETARDAATGTIVLECDQNISRFRRGDTIVLSADGHSFPVELLDFDGTRLEVKGELPQGSQPWLAEAAPPQPNDLVRQALQGIRPAPEVDGSIVQLLEQAGERDHLNGLPAPLAIHPGMQLNEQQAQAAKEAVNRPRLWGMQGPPGTGKSRVASMVAESLAGQGDVVLRRNRRRHAVLVVAQTHEAVNNLLNCIVEMFPQRGTCKIGNAMRNVALDASVTRLSVGQYFQQRRDLRDRGAIIGMTLHLALALSHQADGNPVADTIIVDEAGQVPLASGAALGRLAPSVLLFGDVEQLPPIYAGDAGSHDLAMSVLERVDRLYGLSFLPTTYRMNDVITDAIGRAYYPDENGASRLSATLAAAARRFPIVLVDPTHWVDVALSPDTPIVWVQTQEQGQYQSSEHEARIIHCLTTRMLQGGLRTADIAILTPFRQQVRQIQATLADMPPGVRIDTIERLQGQEAEAVIVSAACSSPAWLAENARFFFNDARWNVAASRGRTKLIFVGSATLGQVRLADDRLRASMDRFMTLLNEAAVIKVPANAD